MSKESVHLEAAETFNRKEEWIDESIKELFTNMLLHLHVLQKNEH